MDPQPNSPTPTQPTSTPPVAAKPTPPPILGTNPPVKPKIQMTDAQAQALLQIHNLQPEPSSNHLSPKVIILAVGFIVLSLLFSYFMGGVGKTSGSKSGGSSTTSAGSSLGIPSQSSTPSGSNDTTQQINNDANACSNPLNALTVC